jgi:hypothetical protein
VVLGLRVGNFGVYVYAERGQRHHLPHAHIKQGGRRVATVFLVTLAVYDSHQRLPGSLLEGIEKAQDDLLDLWVELNGDD